MIIMVCIIYILLALTLITIVTIKTTSSIVPVVGKQALLCQHALALLACSYQILLGSDTHHTASSCSTRRRATSLLVKKVFPIFCWLRARQQKEERRCVGVIMASYLIFKKNNMVPIGRSAILRPQKRKNACFLALRQTFFLVLFILHHHTREIRRSSRKHRPTTCRWSTR